MKKIPLSKYNKNPKYKGFFALVDDDDYDALACFNWTATRVGKHMYAMRSTPRDENGKQKLIYMHNQIMCAKWIDHIDNDGLNNQKSNLRKSDPKTNSHNRRPKKNTQAGFIGVSKSGKSAYRSRIRVNGKTIHLVTNKDPVVCAKAYNDAALKYRGAFAYLNKIDK